MWGTGKKKDQGSGHIGRCLGAADNLNFIQDGMR